VSLGRKKREERREERREEDGVWMVI